MAFIVARDSPKYGLNLLKHSIDKSVSSVPPSKGFKGANPSTSTAVSQGLYDMFPNFSFLLCSKELIIGTISWAIASWKLKQSLGV